MVQLQLTKLLLLDNIVKTLIVGTLVLLVPTSEFFAQRIIPIDIRATEFIDVCGDRNFVVTGHIGTITKDDSLMLFDVPIAYDSKTLTPRFGLFLGTLGETLPESTRGFGKIDDTTARMYGFSITKVLVGSAPLFAYQFSFKGNCEQSGKIYIPFQPEVNDEAKAKVRFDVIDTIIISGNIGTSTQRSLKLQATKRNDTAEVSTARTVVTKVIFPKDSKAELYQIEVVPRNAIVERIETAESNHTIDSIVKSGSKEVVYIRKGTSDTATILCTLRSNQTGLDIINFNVLKTQPNCNCINSVENDSVTIDWQNVTSVKDETEFVDNEMWTVYSLLGKNIIEVSTKELKENSFQLPTGMYVVVNNTKQKIKKIIK